MIDLAEDLSKVSYTTLDRLRAMTIVSLLTAKGEQAVALREHLDRIEQELRSQ